MLYFFPQSYPFLTCDGLLYSLVWLLLTPSTVFKLTLGYNQLTNCTKPFLPFCLISTFGILFCVYFLSILSQYFYLCNFDVSNGSSLCFIEENYSKFLKKKNYNFYNLGHNILRLFWCFMKFFLHHKWRGSNRVRIVIGSNKHGIHDLPHQFLSDVRLRILGN